MKKRIVSLLMVLCLALTLIPAVGAASFSDMPGDSTAQALSAAAENGLLQGKNGKIMPADKLTRAQMATILVRAFGSNGQADLSSFRDAPASAWYYADLAKAVKMKAFQGGQGLLRPNDSIKRQEAFAVLARALKLEDGTAGDLAAYTDANQVSAYAVGPLAALVKGGYVHGNGGKLNPQADITRAQFAVIMDNLFKTYIKTPGTVTQVGDGSVVVSVPDVTLKNLTVKGNLILGDGVGDGTVTLDNVKVQGTTVIRGGGVNSIIVKSGSTLGTVIVAKVDGNVRIHVEGGAAVEVLSIDDGRDDVIVDGSVSKLVVTASGVPVIVQNAAVQELTVTGADASVTIAKGSSVTTLTTAPGASGAQIAVSSGATVNAVSASAAGTVISGAGTVKTVTAGANNVSVTTAGTQVTAAAGTSGVTAGGKAVPGGSSTTTSGGSVSGGGGGTPQRITLSPATGSAYVKPGNTLPESLVTLSSNYNVSGLTTVISLSKGGAAVDFNTVFSSYTLSTQVGDGNFSKPYDMNGAHDQFSYGPPAGYSITAGVDQVTAANGTVKSDAPTGIYVVKTEVKSLATGTVLASGIYTLTVDSTAPDPGSVTPAAGAVVLNAGADFVLEVSSKDATGLYSLEVDHSLEGTLPEFTVYADASNPYGNDTAKSEFVAAGVTVAYAADSAGAGTWTIDFGPAVTNVLLANGGITFYFVIRDVCGNAWGSMSSTVTANTFQYHSITRTGTAVVSTGQELTDAVAQDGIDTILLKVGTYTLTQQLNINKSLTIQGIGAVTIQAPTEGTWGNNNSTKHLLSIYAGTQAAPVTLENLTLDSNGRAYGVQAYDGASVILNNVTIQNSRGAGLTVNGSTVTATNLIANGNFPGDVNVDPGEDVTTKSVFTMNSGELSGLLQIWSDGANVSGDEDNSVTIHAPGYLEYDVPVTVGSKSTLSRIFSNRAGYLNFMLPMLGNSIDLNKTTGTTLTLASAGETYTLDQQLTINKSLTIRGVGGVTIQAGNASNPNWAASDSFPKPDSNFKHLVEIDGSAAAVTLSNLTLDSNHQAYGVQAYGSTSVILDNVAILNSRGAGLTVNGSTVTANNLNTSGNAWGGVNVDPGEGVKTASIFNLSGTGTLGDTRQIWSDGKNVDAQGTVTVTAQDYTPSHPIVDNSKFTVWTRDGQ